MKTKIQLRNASAGLLFLGLLSCGGSPTTEATYDRAEAEAQIRKIEHAWAQVAVSGDPAIIEEIFADDFVGIAPDGTQYTKQGFIDDTKKNPLGFTSNELNAMTVRFEGNVAIAHGDETFTRKTGDRGRFVWTDVLVRRNGAWQIIAAQDAMIEGAAPSTSAGLFAAPAAAEQEREGIDKTRSAYVAAWRAGNAGAVAQLYTDDALVLYPDQPAVQGKAAINAYFKTLFAEFPQNQFELTSAEIEIVGPWAFDRGAYRWKGIPRAGGEPAEDNGKYLVILQRQADGEWKVARDMDNSDRPKSQATRGTP